MVIQQIKSIEDYNNTTEQKASLFYFSHDACNVCKVLKPKIKELLETEFEQMQMHYIDIKATPDIAAQSSIFTVPTILVFLDGKEFIRKSRNIGIDELRQEMERPYSILFE